MPFTLCTCSAIIYVGWYGSLANDHLMKIKCPDCAITFIANIGFSSYKKMLPLIWCGTETWQKRSIDRNEKENESFEDLYEEEINKYKPTPENDYESGFIITTLKNRVITYTDHQGQRIAEKMDLTS